MSYLRIGRKTDAMVVKFLEHQRIASKRAVAAEGKGEEDTLSVWRTPQSLQHRKHVEKRLVQVRPSGEDIPRQLQREVLTRKTKWNGGRMKKRRGQVRLAISRLNLHTSSMILSCLAASLQSSSSQRSSTFVRTRR